MKDGDYSIDAISEKEIYEEARDRLAIAESDESANRQQAKSDLIFREGEGHWDNSPVTTKSQEVPQLTINLTDALVTRVVNNMKQQRPRGKCHPVSDGATVESAEVVNGIGRHIEYRSEASVAYDTGGESAVAAGWGWARLIAEFPDPKSFDREIRILPVQNIFTVYVDPNAMMPTAYDMKWGIITIKQKRNEFKRTNPRADLIDWKGSTDKSDLEWEDRETIRLAEYFRIYSKSEMLYEVKDADGNVTNRWKSDMPEPDLLLASGLTITNERQSAKDEVQWFLLNGKKVVKREVLPGQYIPIVRFEGNAVVIDGKIYRRGMVKAMRDPQKMVDYGESAKIRRLGLTPQSPWIAAEGQLDGHPEWTSANMAAHPTLIYKPVTVDNGQGGQIPLPPPQRQPPAQIEAGFTEFVQGMRTNLLAVAGMPNEPGADANGQVVSGVAIKRRQGLSDQSHYQYYDKQTLAIAQIWRIMLEWIPYYYSEQRMQRIIGEDGMPSMITINQATISEGVKQVKNDLSLGRYDVVMDTGPGYDTKREENSDNVIALMSNKAIGEIVMKVAPDLIFRGLDYPYAQEIADRLSAQTPEGLQKLMEGMSSQAKSVITSLSAQNQQLQKALQEAQIENKYGMAKAHLTAVTKAHDTEESNKTKRDDTQTRAETSRFDTVVKSRTELAKAEITAGASLLNTHAEAEHHKEEAEMMIEKADRAETGSVQ